MLEQISPQARELFLKKFTEELIKNYARQNQIEFFPQEIPQPKRISPETPYQRIPLQQTKQIPQRIIPPQERKRLSALHIPDVELPQRLRHIKPYPTELEIELGKLNPLLKDPAVKTIECHGAGEPIVVKGTMGTKPTTIILNKEEVEDTIKKFSEESKIPVKEGVFKMVVGKLIMSVVKSNVLGSKFIINKMSLNQMYFQKNLPHR